MEFNQITRIIFQNKKSYDTISPDEKEKLFFIFNRTIARGLPIASEFLNNKNIDTALAMDIWFNNAKNITKIPEWFSPNWTKLKKNKEESLLKKYDAMDKVLLSYYPDAIEAEKQKKETEKEDIIQTIKKKSRNKK